MTVNRRDSEWIKSGIAQKKQQFTRLDRLRVFAAASICLISIGVAIAFPSLAAIPAFIPLPAYGVMLGLSTIVPFFLGMGTLLIVTDDPSGITATQAKNGMSTKMAGLGFALAMVGFSVASGVCLGIPPIVIGVIGGSLLLASLIYGLSAYKQHTLIKEIRELEAQIGIQVKTSEEKPALDRAPVATFSKQPQVPKANPTLQQRMERLLGITPSL